jgi:hypothetical protein
VYADLRTRPDLELVGQLFAPDFQYHLLDGSVTVHGPKGHGALEGIYWAVYFPRHQILETLVPVGEIVVTRWWTWTTSGYAHDPTENPFTASPDEAQSASGTTIWRLEDRKSPKPG